MCQIVLPPAKTKRVHWLQRAPVSLLLRFHPNLGDLKTENRVGSPTPPFAKSMISKVEQRPSAPEVAFKDDEKPRPPGGAPAPQPPGHLHPGGARGTGPEGRRLPGCEPGDHPVLETSLQGWFPSVSRPEQGCPAWRRVRGGPVLSCPMQSRGPSHGSFQR